MTSRPSPRTRPWAYATLGVVFASTSLVLVLSTPSTEVPRLFAAAALGVAAVVAGTQALRRRPAGWPTTHLAARAGAVGGSAALGLLAYALAGALLLPAGVRLPSLPYPSPAPAAPPVVDGSGADLGAPPSAGVADVEDAGGTAPSVAPAPPASADAERAQLAQATGTIAFVLRQWKDAGVALPTEVLVTGSSSPVLATPQGEVLGPVPAGVTVFYATAVGQVARQVVLELHGGTYGQIARWDSETDMVTLG